jgi:hypothetical protein
MEDNDILSGTIGTSETPMHGATLVFIKGSNLETISSINTQSPAPSPYHNPKNYLLINLLYGITSKMWNQLTRITLKLNAIIAINCLSDIEDLAL